MKFILRVVGNPQPIGRGASESIVSRALRLLEEHPSYTVTLQSYGRNLDPAHHRIMLTFDPADGTRGTITASLHHDPVLRPHPTSRQDADLDEITTILSNIGTPTITEEHP